MGYLGGHSFTRCPLHTIPTTEFRYHLDFSRYPSPEVRKNTLLFPLLLYGNDLSQKAQNQQGRNYRAIAEGSV